MNDTHSLVRPLVARQLRRAEVCTLLGISTATFHRRLLDGTLPRGRRISARIQVWDEAELRSFLSSRSQLTG